MFPSWLSRSITSSPRAECGRPSFLQTLWTLPCSPSEEGQTPKVHRIITSSNTICLQSSDLCTQPLDSRRTRPPLSWLQQIPGTETDICRKHICQFETLPKTYLPTWNIAKRGCSTLKSRSPRMSRESTSFSTSSLHRYISLYKRCSLLNSFMARAHIL